MITAEVSALDAVQIYQWGSLLAWGILVGALVAMRRHRAELWTLLAITLTFPVELVYAKAFRLTYSGMFWQLYPDLGLPLTLPFAYGAFFGAPLLLSVVLMRRLPRVPLSVGVVGMLLMMFAYSLIVEAWTMRGASDAWSYAWSPGEFIPGGLQPWIVPVTGAVNLPAFHLAHGWATRVGAGLADRARFALHLGAAWGATLVTLVISLVLLAAVGGPH